MGGGKYNVITYWYLISWVLNFVILARQYFAGFYFWDSIGQFNMKKGFKFRDNFKYPQLDFSFKSSELFEISR